MWDKYFDKIVNYLWKHQNKIITNEKIKEKLEQILDTDYSDQKMYKVVYFLKTRGYLINLKKNLFFVKDPQRSYNEEELAQTYYRDTLKTHSKEFIQGKRYIWGLKALEISLLSYIIPEEILIVNQKKQASETIILEKKALLKTYQSKEKNLFPFLYKYTNSVTIGKYKFQVAKPELAILETLYNSSPMQKHYGEELIKKYLKKNKKNIQFEIFETILRLNKHNSSINRLLKISQSWPYPEIEEQLKKLIKKYGYFIYS